MPRGRAISRGPEQFSGTLSDLYALSEPVMPAVEEVVRVHRQLVALATAKDPVFIVRYVLSTPRGTLHTTRDGTRFLASDNAPAWWVHFVAYNSIRDPDWGTVPAHFHHVQRAIHPHISGAGWHVAHIFDAKDRNTDWMSWTRQEVLRRCFRHVAKTSAE